MVVHDLKTTPDHFIAVRSGRKKVEFRVNDRGFQVGDVLHLREYMPEFKSVEAFYSGQYVLARVTHILRLNEFLGDTAYVALSIENLAEGF